MKIETLIEEIRKEVTEPRRVSHGNIQHKLEDIIIIGLCTVICGGEDFADMETFGLEREAWLQQFLELPNGIPDSDTFRRLFERLNPQELARSLRQWLDMERTQRGVIAVDGKTIRGSGNGVHKPYHVISAFAAENQLTLGELAVDEKSNEITAVPQLLELVDVRGAIVTTDAMSCQKKIVQAIAAGKADYVIGLKENQPMLLHDAQLYFQDFQQDMPSSTTLEKGHGRIERREYCLLTDLDWLSQQSEWANLRGLGMVHTSVIQGNAQVREEKRYYITSLTSVDEFAYAVRKHWAVENQLHWCLDVIFDEDASRARKDNSPLNMNVLRKQALVLLNAAKFGRLSKKTFMFKAALNPDMLLHILFPPTG
ncbi:MAG: ISAs1 family transposase [Clostridia bacterium]|nr:ISAs1 family transposase [Clostridia bacterium]